MVFGESHNKKCHLQLSTSLQIFSILALWSFLRTSFRYTLWFIFFLFGSWDGHLSGHTGQAMTIRRSSGQRDPKNTFSNQTAPQGYTRHNLKAVRTTLYLILSWVDCYQTQWCRGRMLRWNESLNVKYRWENIQICLI